MTGHSISAWLNQVHQGDCLTLTRSAEAQGRDWIGMELSAEYCELANHRIPNLRRLI